MLQRRILIRKKNILLVMKDWSIGIFFGDSAKSHWENRYKPHWIYTRFRENQHNVELKEDYVYIDIEKNNKYTLSVQYISINRLPFFFIMPEKDTTLIEYYENNDVIAKRLYTFAVLGWLLKYVKNNHFLHNLYKIFYFIYHIIRKTLHSESGMIQTMSESEFLLSETTEACRRCFFKYHYQEVLSNVINNHGSEILSNLEILSENKINKVDLWDIYRNNVEYKKAIDAKVVEILNDMLKTSHKYRCLISHFDLARLLDRARKRYIGFSGKKFLRVLYHNEINQVLCLHPWSYTFDIYAGKDKNSTYIRPNLFVLLKNKHNIINWLYGHFNIMLNIPILIIYKSETSVALDLIKKVAKEARLYRYNNVKAKFRCINDRADIEKIAIWRMPPGKKLLDMMFDLDSQVILNPRISLLINNERTILNVLVNTSSFVKIANQIIILHPDIENRPLLALGITAPIRKLIDYEVKVKIDKI